MQLLKFSTGNAKLGKRLIFSLPAGYSCPNAGVCKTMANRTTGKIMDLPQQPIDPTTDYRCFAAMSEGVKCLSSISRTANTMSLRTNINEQAGV
jgi:hypothetical protein